MADEIQDNASGAEALSDAKNPAAETADEQVEQTEQADGDEASESENDESSERPKKKRSGNNYAKKLERTRTELAQARAELEQFKQPKAQNTVDATQKPSLDQFKSYDDYVEALSEWKAEQVSTRKEQKQADEQEKVKRAEADKKRFETYAKKIPDAKARYPDFEQKLAEFDDVDVRNDVIDAIMDANHGPDIAYFIANNEDWIDKLNNMSQREIDREIGRLDERLGNGQVKAADAKVTQAPQPIRPVSAKKSSSHFNADETETLEEFHAARKKGLI